MKTLLQTILFAMILFPATAFAQTGVIEITPVQEEVFPLIKAVHNLIGPGVELVYVKSNQEASTPFIGAFSDPSRKLGMEQGMVMSTGFVNTSIGPNNVENMTGLFVNAAERRDKILEKITGFPSFDACTIEMEVVPSGDTLHYVFLFGSEEYDEYVGSPFNDVFTMHIKGPGIAGWKNLAVVPGTDDAVCVNNINRGGLTLSGFVTPSNPGLYLPDAGKIGLQFDGYTRLIDVRQPVQAGKTYKIRLSIADISDPYLDSGIFLESRGMLSYAESWQLPFETGEAFLSAGYQGLLEEIASAILKQDCAQLIITGHADAVGSSISNLSLSKARAEEIARLLEENFGVDAAKIELRYKGESLPVSGFGNTGANALNRRVEVMLIPSCPEG